MPGAQVPNTGSDETVNAHPNLAPETQKDLAHALKETVSAQDAWVKENRRELFNSFAKGKKYDAMPQKNIDVVTAEEGTERDLRHALVSILSIAGCKRIGRK